MELKATASLNESVFTIYSASSKSKMLTSALEAVRVLCGADESAFLLPAPHGRHFELLALSGAKKGRLVRTRVHALEGFEKWIYSTGTALLFPGAARSLQDAQSLKARSLFTAPCVAAAALSAAKIMGVLAASNRSRERRFHAGDLETLQWLARHTAQALERAHRYAAEQAFNLELRRQVKATTSQLRAANEILRQADAAKSELISTVAHELRTPITSISGFSKLLFKGKAGPLSQEQEEFCQIICKNSESVEHLINDLLDITKFEQSRLEMHSEALSLNTLVWEALLTWQAGKPKAEQRLQAELPPEAVLIRGDRMRLLQVINNFLSNAHKYSPPATPIRIRLVADASVATLSVHNQGHPLTPEQRVKVFEKFYRIRNQATRNVPGTGLGLAIAKSIIQAHGGNIWAQNDPPAGAAFLFSLPLSGSQGDPLRAFESRESKVEETL